MEQIEGDKDALAAPEQQVSKIGPAGFVNASDLAIENGAFDFNVLRDPGSELCKAAERIPVPGYQFATAVLQMG
jgi:hypothetical protein